MDDKNIGKMFEKYNGPDGLGTLCSAPNIVTASLFKLKNEHMHYLRKIMDSTMKETLKEWQVVFSGDRSAAAYLCVQKISLWDLKASGFEDTSEEIILRWFDGFQNAGVACKLTGNQRLCWSFNLVNLAAVF